MLNNGSLTKLADRIEEHILASQFQMFSTHWRVIILGPKPDVIDKRGYGY